jgi:hypothetical protein
VGRQQPRHAPVPNPALEVIEWVPISVELERLPADALHDDRDVTEARAGVLAGVPRGCAPDPIAIDSKDGPACRPLDAKRDQRTRYVGELHQRSSQQTKRAAHAFPRVIDQQPLGLTEREGTRSAHSGPAAHCPSEVSIETLGRWAEVLSVQAQQRCSSGGQAPDEELRAVHGGFRHDLPAIGMADHGCVSGQETGSGGLADA